jgi:hypothetical protein
MKRTIIGLSLLLFASGLALSQSIEVTSPKGGEVWMVGSAKTIIWTAKGFPAGTLARLTLLLNGAKVGDIAVKVPIGQGTWNWEKAGNYIGGTAAAGKGYEVRVRDMNNAYKGAKSPAAFTLESLMIISQSALGRNLGLVLISAIPVSSPGAGLAFKPGEELLVVWDKSKIATYPQVALDVFAPDKKTKIGPIGTAASSLRDNTGKYEAVIFNARYVAGKDYIIRVATPDEKNIGWSSVFHVTPLTAVAETETFTGSHTAAYTKADQSNFLGCLNKMGLGANLPPAGFWAVGWDNGFDDPFGPCWTYVGHIYRTIVDPSGIYKGFEVTKAILYFSVNQGTKQTLYILRRDAPGDALDVPATTVATIGAWEFGPTIQVDVTAVVQAWCTGQAPNYGLIIRGGDEGYAHNNVEARCLITQPQLVITKINYK